MSGPEGVAVWSEIAGTVWWFTDQAVARAYPDGVGGVVFQTSGEAEAGPRCHPIWRLEGPDAEPEVIHSGPDLTNQYSYPIADIEACDILHAAGAVDGAPHIIITHPLGEDPPALTALARAVPDGSPTELLWYTAIDGALISASISQRRLALTFQGSSDQGSALFHDADGAATTPPFPPPADPIGEGDCWVGALSRDGRRLAWGSARWSCAVAPFELRIMDLESGAELTRVDLPGDVESPGIDSVSFNADGDQVIVTFVDLAPWIITVDGTITSLDAAPDAATISFWDG